MANFGQVVEHVKSGGKAARDGWNGLRAITLMSDQCCQNCKFVALEKDQFHCRRFPPNAQVLIVPRKANVMMNQVVPVEETRSMFPNVHPGWICGEFALKVQLLS